MNPVAVLLTEPGRVWHRADPATEAAIAELSERTGLDWPEALLNLWRYSNGGEGEVALPPQWFHLSRVQEVPQLNSDCNIDGDYDAFQFFGTNGGMETIGLDLTQPNRPVFMIDLIAGVESVEYIADNAWEFIQAIGLEYEEDA